MVETELKSLGRLDELIAALQAQRDVLKSRLDQLDTDAPSFDQGVSPVLAADAKAGAARRAVEDAATEISALMLGPQGVLSKPPHNHWTSLQVIIEFGLATAIPPDSDEGKTFEELGQLASPPLDADVVKRIMRHATTLYIFKESPPGTIRHNATSRYLARTPEMRAFETVVLDQMWPAACQVSTALKKWHDPEEPNQCGWSIAKGTELSMFKYFGQYPEKARDFAGLMSWFASGPGMEVRHLVDGYHWTEIKEGGMIVDIGGSQGDTVLAIRQKYPKFHFVVQDFPHVVEEGKQKLSPTTTSVSFMAHDFFNVQPVKKADVYLMRMICHDWSDKYAAAILAAIVPAMGEDSRIVIMEQIIPEPGRVPVTTERFIRSFDLAMLAIQNGRERELANWESLCARADPRLKITGTFQPEGSAMALIEVRLTQ